MSILDIIFCSSLFLIFFQVIYRVLNPTDPISNPYSTESKHLLNVTNLRIQMWKPQTCSKCNISEKNLAGFKHFAVYDLIIRGTCFCNGHADSCVASEKGISVTHQQAVVSLCNFHI